MLAWLIVIASFAGAGASLWYLPKVGSKLAVVLSIIGFIAMSFQLGVQYANRQCDTASLRAELRTVRDDLDAAFAAAEKATEIQISLNKAERKNTELVDALSKIPDACLASDTDANRLRQIGPSTD